MSGELYFLPAKIHYVRLCYPLKEAYKLTVFNLGTLFKDEYFLYFGQINNRFHISFHIFFNFKYGFICVRIEDLICKNYRILI